MGDRYVYFFGNGQAEGNATMKNTLGGKGAGLAEMTNLGVPVPPGFTISTEACVEYFKNNGAFPPNLWKEVLMNLDRVEQVMGKKFGDENAPLLVSVRSGARVSMPGMMDTVLNLGLNDRTVEGLARANRRFAFDSYRRFITMFGDVVLGVPRHDFEAILDGAKKGKGVHFDTDLDESDLAGLIERYKELVNAKLGYDFPQDPLKQLELAVKAVFESWNGARAITYRKLHGVPSDWGTAVNVQAMVFGNMGDDSGTGVCFTRDPANGENYFYGEFLMNAQGEDVVAGTRTPLPISKLQEIMPEVYGQLVDVRARLERHYLDIQDMEFTIEKGRLFMLQTRVGKRTAAAAVKIAVDLCDEGIIDRKTAVLRVDPNQLDQLLHMTIDPKAKVEVIAKGLPASPGAAVGRVVFTAERAEELAATGEPVILVRNETSPEDIGGMHASKGILTARGGMTSHAAVVARGMGKCCVAGCGEITVNEQARMFTVKGIHVREGDFLTLNGTTGEVILGQAALVKPELTDDFRKLMEWADEFRTLKVRTNADTPHDAQVARNFGAEGIGLCRTEHMFFGEDRIPIVRAMIMAKTVEERQKYLDQLLPMQRGDFEGIFQAMDGLPVTIRLLDPPLHEFLPNHEELVKEIAEMKLKMIRAGSFKEIDGILKKLEEAEVYLARANQLAEFNPMLGHRGCRLGVTYPAMYKMQVQAIFEATVTVARQGKTVIPEVMIPLVGSIKEYTILAKDVHDMARTIMAREGITFTYAVGTMIEVPRAALIADKIAAEAEFFSFGTNDLTQMTYGFSRDDIAKFLPDYIEKGILPQDPFQSIDAEGVGQLVEMGVARGRMARPNLKVGVCGEHGGDPASVEFFNGAGLNYVSCSPYRVPVARLAAAHAALKTEGRQADRSTV
jgi:pyruvate,orthophosphate dikinase